MRLLLLSAVLLALPLHAQETLTVGDSVSGALGSDDPVLADGSHYRLYRLPLATAQRVRVVLLSADFDAFLAVEHSDMPNGACATDDCQTDDDSGGGTDAMVDFVALRDGMHTIRVNSLNGGETGSYTLLIERGIAPDPRQFEEEYRSSLAAVLAEAKLDTPADQRPILGGRRGHHSEHLGHILAPMQFLPRTYPDAKW